MENKVTKKVVVKKANEQPAVVSKDIDNLTAIACAIIISDKRMVMDAPALAKRAATVLKELNGL